ncbi:MAG: hypothetical protein MMC33_005188 [Icmadophila ericetorum]|nr:hypothetical protein [Icmadophila ericetorum]
MFATLGSYALLLSVASAVAIPPISELRPKDIFPSGYTPVKATCPSTPLVRAANGLSSSETAYISARQAVANPALAAWLTKTGAGFQTSKLPKVALATSGGGYRSLLTGAGVIQGFDSRDSKVGTSGVFQGLIYQAGLSGGAWLLSSFAGNNYPTISYLQDNLWEGAFQDSLLIPANFLAAVAYVEITNDIIAKNDAGFPPTLTDPWGRLLSYQLLQGSDGGVGDTVSGLTTLSNFTSHAVPYPIIVANGVKVFEDQCAPGPNATIYEIHPYEFGSWDAGVKAFMQTKYLGTSLNNGVVNGSCYNNYDNLGYALGTSSNLFNEVCSELIIEVTNLTSGIEPALEVLLALAHETSTRDEYAVYPNPFYNSPQSPLVSSQQDLFLVDGGEALQNLPMWPLIQNARAVDVIIANDNSADTNNYPNGTSLLMTYTEAQAAGLTRMPVIPSVATFLSEGLNQHPTFFGCNDASKITVIYLPNQDYSTASNVSTDQLEYSETQTAALIANGQMVASKGGDKNWPTCLGCALMKKTGTTLPSACTACFTEYCYN